jgi:2-iminobutanoate/2-iminopropanoate deaminase
MMGNRTVHTDDAPQALGPYSQAVECALSSDRKLVFTAGQIGLDPATMEIVEGGIETQTEQVVRNLTAILEAAGCGWADVVKATVFLADMNDFPAFNEIYGGAISGPPPARSAAAVKDLPKNCLLEMELIAVCDL